MFDCFAFFGIKPRFIIDEKDLRDRYLQKSKENHPDFFVNDEESYSNALEQTSLNNQAYKTLQSLGSRTAHLLELNGLLKEAGNEIPREFLLEMMDFNERLMELEMEYDEEVYKALSIEYKAMEEENTHLLKAAAEKCDEIWEGAEDAEGQLKEIRSIYLKRKYLLRIKESLSKFAGSN